MSGLSDAARPLHFCNEHASVRAFWMESWPDCLGYLEGATCMAEQPEVQTRRLDVPLRRASQALFRTAVLE